MMDRKSTIYRWLTLPVRGTAASLLLFFCSCQAPGPMSPEMAGLPGPQGMPGYPMAGMPANCPPGGFPGGMPPGMLGPGMMPGQPLMNGPPPVPPEGHTLAPTPIPVGPWAPPGVAGPWPADEYIYDGGDIGPPVGVNRADEVDGLDIEDTVAHFETEDGELVVQPSNRVTIYAPRFAAVRTVSGVGLNEQIINPVGTRESLPTLAMQDDQEVLSRQANVPLGRQVTRVSPQAYLGDRWAGIATKYLAAVGFDNSFKAHENYSLIRYGIFEQSEEPFLAQSIDAAVTWESTEAAVVLIDEEKAAEVATDEQAQETYVVYECGISKLRLVKVASKNATNPGEFVDFTLRFDNIGDKTINNVVIMDNLSPRLAYVPESSQASVKNGYLRDEAGEVLRDEEGNPRWKQNLVAFSYTVNEADSSVLRWELAEPLKPGEGGILRFRCLVR
ncbi:DUF11 domain-containing protein [Planctomycetales bacterium 10988]|nr:DUF11 domain-containing protein [Planctomycetales bacterium 10988]